VNAALADFKEGKQGITKKSISRRHGVAVSLLNRYIKHHNIQKGDASTACYELLSRGRPNKVKNIVAIMDKSVKIAKATMKSQHTQKMYTKDAKKLLQQSQTKPMRSLPCPTTRSQLGLARTLYHTALRRSSVQSPTQKGHLCCL
jgi:hypothetical protein